MTDSHFDMSLKSLLHDLEDIKEEIDAKYQVKAKSWSAC